MGNQKDVFATVFLHQSINSCGNPIVKIRKLFPIGHSKIFPVCDPAPQFFFIVGFYVFCCLVFPISVIEFSKSAVIVYFHILPSGDDFRCMSCSSQIAAVNGINGNLPEILPQHFCLLYTRFVDIRICPAIKHISLIHICLSMANQI